MTVLFIGLGAMGAPMARNLSRATDVMLYDVNAISAEALAAELNVIAVRTLDKLPLGVDTVVLMVPESRIVESILVDDANLLDKLPAGSLIIDMSSSAPISTRMLATRATGRAISYIDAPVSGGVARAVTGELAIMVGATAEDFERAEPILRAMGKSILHVGGPGAGDAAKALNNLLSATNIAAAAEILSAAATFGIKPSLMLDVINASTGRSQATEVKYPSFVLTGTFSSGFGLDLMLKDLAIAKTLTSGAGLCTPVTDTAADIAVRSRAHAGSPPDHTEIVRFYEDANHVALRVSNAHSSDVV